MGSAVGLTTRLCTGVETVNYGTVDLSAPRFLEFNSEGLERKNEIMRSNALGSGSLHLRRGSRSVVSGRWGQGPIDMDVVTNGMGRIFRNLIGGTPTIVASATAFTQTHTLGSLLGKSLTIQKQLRDESDTLVSAFTFEGSKFTSGEFKIDKKGKLILSLAVDAEDVNTTTPAATPSLTATKTFHYRQGTLSIAGVNAARVESANVKIDRKMDTDRFHLGNAGVKAEPLVNDFPDVTGGLTAEFAASTYYDLFTGDTAAALVLQFAGDIIAGSAAQELISITVPEVRLTGETPKVGGPGLIKATHPWEAQWDGSSADLTLVYVSSDTAI